MQGHDSIKQGTDKSAHPVCLHKMNRRVSQALEAFAMDRCGTKRFASQATGEANQDRWHDDAMKSCQKYLRA